MRYSPLQDNFNSGEFSPLLYGRVSADRYKSALKTCLNYIPTPQGALTRRPGTKYVAEVKTSSSATRLIPFEYNTTQAYILEFGNQYIRFYKDNAQIQSGLAAYEIATPYTAADLFDIRYAQSADVLYLVHPDYAPRKLSRTGHTQWSLSLIDFQDGPYLNTNNSDGRLSTSIETAIDIFAGTTGSSISTSFTAQGTSAKTTVSSCTNNGSGLIRVTLAAAREYRTGDMVYIANVTGTTEANGSWTVTVISSTVIDLQGSTFVNAYVSGGDVHPGLFRSTDVGRFLRIQNNGDNTWMWLKITAFTNVAIVTATSYGGTIPFGGNTCSNFRLGTWSSASGYPRVVSFYEDRLFFGGALSYPQRLDGSCSGDYENFAPSDMAGTITASHAVAITLNSSDVNSIRWTSGSDKGLLVGTVGNEWVVRASTAGEVLTPTNARADMSTAYGGSSIAPVKAGKSTLFVQRANRKLREARYFFGDDGFDAPDLTELAEHITGTGIVQMALQRLPHQIVWAAREDGTLIGMTYTRDSDSLRAGWHRHELGGTVIGTNGVESVAVIPSADGSRDELWMVVKRTINGSTKRYIEYMTQLFDDLVEQEDAFFVDCGLTYDGSASAAMSGLSHLEGCTVSVLGDGAVLPDKTVASGGVTLDYAVSKAQIGFGYNSDGQMLRLEGGIADGTALGKIRRCNSIGILFHRSLGLKIGTDFEELDTMTFRTTSTPLNEAPELFSGIVTESIEADYDTENFICWRQSQPLPSTILAVMPQVVVQETG